MFVIVGLLGTLFLYGVLNRWAIWKKILFLVVMAIFIGVVWNVLPDSRGSEAWWQSAVWRNAILYVVMLAGMMFRVVWDEIEEWRQHNAKTGVRKKRRPSFPFWQFVYPVMPSLALFQAVLWMADKQDLNLQLILGSFQNGFFWNAILARTKQSLENAAAKP
jgi:hypothetical protein